MKTLLVAIPVLLCLSAPARAQSDFCQRLVDAALYDEVRKYSSAQEDKQGRSEFCRKYKITRDKNSGLATSGRWGLFGGSASGSKNESQSTLDIACGLSISNENRQSAAANYSKQLSPGISAAIQNCSTQNADLQAQSIPEENGVSIDFSYRPGIGRTGAISLREISFDPSYLACSGSLTKIKPEGQLSPGAYVMRCSYIGSAPRRPQACRDVINPGGVVRISTSIGAATVIVPKKLADSTRPLNEKLGTLAFEKKEYDKALPYLALAAECGSDHALAVTGEIYYVRGDKVNARLNFEQAAELGNGHATARLGDISSANGDVDGALRWYLSAADLGVSHGAASAGEIYWSNPALKNCVRAIELFKLAVAIDGNGHAKARLPQQCT